MRLAVENGYRLIEVLEVYEYAEIWTIHKEVRVDISFPTLIHF